MRLVIILATACCCITCLAFAVAQQPNETALPLLSPETASGVPETYHTLNLKLYEKRGDSITTLAEPTIKVIDKQPFSFVAGGEIKNVTPPLEYGISVNGTVEKSGEDHARVAVRISNGNPIKIDDPNITAVQSRCIDVRMNVERSETKSIQIDANNWFDIRVD